jgi:CBS domain-containing protein
MIETTIEPVLSDAAATVSPDLPTSDAAQRLRDPAVPALVVLDERAHVAGIVTDSDFVALAATHDDAATVAELMSTPVVSVPPETPVGLAADRMTEAGVKQLPVVSDSRYIGLVSLESIAPYLSRNRLRVVWKGEPIRLESTTASGTTETESSFDRTINS